MKYLSLVILAITLLYFNNDLVAQGQLTEMEKLQADGLPISKSMLAPSYNNTTSDGMHRCLTDQSVAARRISHPQERQMIRRIMEDARSKVSGFISCDGTNTIIIPVAVHFDDSFDCSNTQCLIDAALGNIASMNDDFAAINADIAYYNDYTAACPAGYPATSVSDGTCISFCLATQNHPVGEGLVDGQPAITIGKYNWSGGPDAPNFAGYFNVFVASNSGGLGIAAAPGLANGDGVQVDAQTFGGPGLNCASGASLNTNTTYNLGRTLTHEAGHYFDLFHTFQGGCGDGDTGTFSGQTNVINDTPATSAPFFGCPPSPASCADVPASNCGSMYAQITNYMDYTDDACMVMFSMDQAAVMNGWANSLPFVDNATACGALTNTALAACQISAGFGPADGSTIVLCTDNGNTINLLDMTTNGPISWSWTFAVTSGDLVLGSTSETTQNPSITITGGTTGTIDVTLMSCDAAGGCSTVTQTLTVSLVSGANCPNDCDYTFDLTDSFGDGWDGAFIEIFVDGSSIGTFTVGVSFDSFVIPIADGATVDVVYTTGAFENEHSYVIIDPFGNTIFSDGPNPGAGTTFVASCTAPTCTDGIQNGSEAGVDCGGTACAPCPVCEAGLTEIINELFDACVLPDGWTVTATDGGTADIIFTAGPNDVPGGGAGPPSDFAGCIALIDDDANDAIGIGCILTPVIDLTQYTTSDLTFDWQHEAFAGGGDFLVQVWDGTMWVTVFSADDDSNGNDEMVNLDAYSNAAFQIQFCYDDEGGFQWGAGIDNVSVCGEPVPVAAIPTMGEWGLMILGLLMLICSIVAIRQRKETFSMS